MMSYRTVTTLAVVLLLFPLPALSSDTDVEEAYRIRMMRSLPAGRSLVVRGPSTERPGVILMGQRGYDDKNARLRAIKGEALTMEATGYSPRRPSTFPHTDGTTALGLPAGYGVVAVDPQVIPLGTRLYVEGYGYAIAADVGGAIQKRRIDLCFNSRKNALRFGREAVRVHIIGWGGAPSNALAKR